MALNLTGITASMTPRQIYLARHALGLPNTQKRSYRNRFYAAKGQLDEADWNEMVSNGYAVRHSHILDLYFLTDLGAQAALEQDEALDREDFPKAA